MRQKTMIFIVSTLVLIGIWDVYAIVFGGKEASISHVMIEWGYEYPSFTFLIGFAMGHLFWRMRTTKIMSEKRIE
jgi:hypothetical protein